MEPRFGWALEKESWTEETTGAVWLVPTMGGVAQPFIVPPVLPERWPDGKNKYGPGAMLAVWSPDGEKILSHEYGPGDPIFTTDRTGGNRTRLFVDKPGSHCHFPIWSPDGRFVYFVRGLPTVWDMDLWRIPSVGGTPERLTNHHSRVGYPAFLDDRTLIYAAVGEDGSGSAIYTLDVDRRIAHRVSFGLEEYISVAASKDGRRLVATVANPSANLWTVPITDSIAEESAARRFSVPNVRSASPRFGPNYLLYLSATGTAAGLWKYKDGASTELWKGTEGALRFAPAVSPDGSQICFSVRRQGKSLLHITRADGTDMRPLAQELDVRDTASWSPDGRWIAVSASQGEKSPLFKVPVRGGAPIRLLDSVTFNPVWSPDGRVIVYSESLAGAIYQVKAVTPDGVAVRLPELWVRSEGHRYRFLPNGKALVLMQGEFRRQDFWLLDFRSDGLRQLTNLRPGSLIRSFDVSPDGKQIVFDRVRENSDIVLIDLKR